MLGLQVLPVLTSGCHFGVNHQGWGIRRIRGVDRIVLRFPSLDKRHQNIQAVALGRISVPRHQTFDLRERAPVVYVGLYRFDFHVSTHKWIAHRADQSDGARF